MSQRDTILWCPHCQQPAPQAPLPQLASDEDLIGRLSTTADPQGCFRRHYCLECRAIWKSVQLPSEFVEGLLASRAQCEELRREMAMLRFLLANRRQRGTALSRAA